MLFFLGYEFAEGINSSFPRLQHKDYIVNPQMTQIFEKRDMVIRAALTTARTGVLSGLFHQRFSFPLINILRTSAPAIGPKGIT